MSLTLCLTGNEPRQQYLFSELAQATSVPAILSFDDIDVVTKCAAAAFSFAMPRTEWWGNYQMHPLLHRRRRRVLARGLESLPARPDALLMWGSWFHPFVGYEHLRVPFFNYIDQSRSLAPLPGERKATFSKRRKSHALQAATYRDSAGIFCWSEWARRQTLDAHEVDPAKVHVVGWGPCAINLSDEEPAERSGPPTILHVSNHFYRKGVDFLIATASRIRDAMPEARFVVIGKDASGMSIKPPPNVEILGPITQRSVLADHFRKADVFFLPHRFDRSPHVLVEAMSAGLALVSSSQGGPIELIRGKGTGFEAAVGDIDGYAEALIALLRDRDACRQAGLRGRKLVREYYNWHSIAQRMLGVMSDRLSRTI